MKIKYLAREKNSKTNVKANEFLTQTQLFYNHYIFLT